jgi:hypothetical protein
MPSVQQGDRSKHFHKAGLDAQAKHQVVILRIQPVFNETARSQERLTAIDAHPGTYKKWELPR